MKDDKIDIVYLWVDGSDKKWVLQKNKWYKIINGKTPIYKGSADKERYRDNGELKYSLRSVAECVPWINHIYIITGFNQVPKWLNTKNPKISIIPHEQIFPQDALPTFNATAIEMCVPKIKNLSERFILMNDDTMFNKKIKPGFFFTEKGKAIVLYNHYPKHSSNLNKWKQSVDEYTQTLINSANILDVNFGKKMYTYRPSHGIDPYLKSSIIECMQKENIKKQINKQIYYKFRTTDEIQRWTFNLYDLMTSRAIFKKAHSYKSGKHKLSNFIYNTLHFYAVNHSPVFCFDAIESLQSIKHAPIFCINDSKDSTKQTRANNIKFLKTRFPKKSQFEK